MYNLLVVLFLVLLFILCIILILTLIEYKRKIINGGKKSKQDKNIKQDNEIKQDNDYIESNKKNNIETYKVATLENFYQYIIDYDIYIIELIKYLQI